MDSMEKFISECEYDLAKANVLAEETQIPMQRIFRDIAENRRSFQNAMLHAFMGETGLKPSEIVLVEQPYSGAGGTGYKWWYEKK